MGKLTGKIAIVGFALAFIFVIFSSQPVYAQDDNEENWESALNDLEARINEQIEELQDLLEEYGYSIDNLYSYIENLVGSSVLGGDMSVYIFSGGSLKEVTPIASSPFPSDDFSPVYVNSNMLLLWVLDKDTGGTIDGTVEISVPMFGNYSEGGWIMMMLLQQGGFGSSMFSFPVRSGIASVPILEGMDEIILTVKADGYKDFKFVVSSGSAPSNEVSITATTLEVGKTTVVTATRNGEPVNGTLILDNGLSGEGMLSFEVPDRDFAVSLKEDGKIVKTKTFYVMSSEEEVEQSSGDAIFYFFIVILSFILMYYLYMRVKGKIPFGGPKRVAIPR